MRRNRCLLITLLASSMAVLSLASPVVLAGGKHKPPKSGTITLMQLQDGHGHIAPHSSILKNGVKDANAGGVAKLATLIKQVRADNPNNLLLGVGDTTHGSAEMLFTLGDAIMPVLNALDIDAFLTGNWDFGWGPRVYRQRFTPNTSIQLAPNNRTTVAWQYPAGTGCNVPGGLNATTYASCHVTKAKPIRPSSALMFWRKPPTT